MQELSRYVASLGIDPFLCGILLGVVATFLIAKSLRSGTKDRPDFQPTPSQSFAKREASGFPAHSITIKEHSFSPDVSAEILEMLSRGDKIQAIKLLREETGLGLAEAKQLAEALEIGNGKLNSH